MRPAILFVTCLYLVVCFTRCRQQEKEHEIYTAADSLIGLTLVLQSRIGSPEIQRMHDFQEEINENLAMLTPVPKEDTTIVKYLELHDVLGQCMQACNQFHEEAFLLETSLYEIMDQVQSKDADPEKLHELLQFEIDNYEDLSRRIDSSLDIAIRQAGILYTLKPEIDRMMEGIVQVQVPDPIP